VFTPRGTPADNRDGVGRGELAPIASPPTARIASGFESTSSAAIAGISMDAPDSLCDDPGNALLCAVQAAWAWRQRDNRFGAPETIDRLEGWIADPHLTVSEPHLEWSPPCVSRD
jgi:hypothetical protein